MPDLPMRGKKKTPQEERRARAKVHGRPVQSEAKKVARRTAEAGVAEIAAMFDKWDRRLSGRRITGNSDELIRQDRVR